MDVLFVQGPQKTATSTLTGILNCHPEIFVLFETYLGQATITKYGNQVLGRYPEARPFFRSDRDYAELALNFFKYLQEVEPHHNYKWVGTKINELDPSFTQQRKSYKIIFTKRDLRTWLVKESIIKRYRTDLDVVIPTIEYLRYIIKSLTYTHAFHFWLEDLIEDKAQVIRDLSDYLNIELQSDVKEWWNQIGNREENDPKSVFKLDHIHHSSRVEPKKLDTTYELKDCEFWNEVNSIFETYYRVNENIPPSSTEIEKDLKWIDKLEKFAPLPFREVYQKVKSVRIGYKKPREVYYLSPTDKTGNKKTLPAKVKERIGRILEINF